MGIAPGVLIAEFEKGALVFNPISWETHLLNLDAVEILRTMGSGEPSPEGDLAVIEQPSPDFGGDNPLAEAPRLDSVNQCIEQLFALGLLEDN